MLLEGRIDPRVLPNRKLAAISFPATGAATNDFVNGGGANAPPLRGATASWPLRSAAAGVAGVAMAARDRRDDAQRRRCIIA